MKKYCRTKINRLDVILAVTCVVFSLISLFIAIGVTLIDKAPLSVYSFQDFLRGLTFDLDIKAYGNDAIFSTITAVLVYGSILVLIVGGISLSKYKDSKERIIALVGALVACFGIALSICLANQFLNGAPC